MSIQSNVQPFRYVPLIKIPNTPLEESINLQDAVNSMNKSIAALKIQIQVLISVNENLKITIDALSRDQLDFRRLFSQKIDYTITELASRTNTNSNKKCNRSEVHFLVRSLHLMCINRLLERFGLKTAKLIRAEIKTAKVNLNPLNIRRSEFRTFTIETNIQQN